MAGFPVTCTGHFYCNTDNPYSAIACCVDAYMLPTYSPYACDFYTTCIDSTRSRSVGLSSLPMGDYVGTLLWYVAALRHQIRAYLDCSSNSQSPYCLKYEFTDIDYTMYTCELIRGITWTARLDTITSDMSQSVFDSRSTSTSTITSTTTRTLISPTSSVVSIFTPTTKGLTSTTAENTVATGQPEPAPEPEDSRPAVGGIVGGVVGGIGAAALIVAAIVRTRRRSKQFAEPAAWPAPASEGLSNSYNQVDHTREDSGYATSLSPPPPPSPLPNIFEVSSDSIRPSGMPEATQQPASSLSAVYQPYRPIPSMDNLSHQSHHSWDSSIHQPYQYRSYASLSGLAPVVEIDGILTPNSHAPTPTSIVPSNQDSGAVELEVMSMSSQSGPVPEWKPNEPR